MNKIRLKKQINKICKLEAKAETLTAELAMELHRNEIFLATGPMASWKEYKKSSKSKFKTLKKVSKILAKIEGLNKQLPVAKRVIVPMLHWKKETAKELDFGEFVKKFYW